MGPPHRGDIENGTLDGDGEDEQQIWGLHTGIINWGIIALHSGLAFGNGYRTVWKTKKKDQLTTLLISRHDLNGWRVDEFLRLVDWLGPDVDF